MDDVNSSADGGPRLSKEERLTALTLAIIVRNAMENVHAEHISDSVMRQLNPIIRNAIATGLHAIAHSHETHAAAYLNYHASHIPKYWEEPELLPGYVSGWTDPLFLPNAPEET